jgi:hypothetical protein
MILTELCRQYCKQKQYTIKLVDKLQKNDKNANAV